MACIVVLSEAFHAATDFFLCISVIWKCHSTNVAKINVKINYLPNFD